MSEPNRADEAQAILEQRDAAGAPKYDHTVLDLSGQWWGRLHADHTKLVRVEPTERAGG